MNELIAIKGRKPKESASVIYHDANGINKMCSVSFKDGLSTGERVSLLRHLAEVLEQGGQ